MRFAKRTLLLLGMAVSVLAVPRTPIAEYFTNTG